MVNHDCDAVAGRDLIAFFDTQSGDRAADAGASEDLMHRLYSRDDRFAVVDHAARNGHVLSERRRQGAREDHEQGYDDAHGGWIPIDAEC